MLTIRSLQRGGAVVEHLLLLEIKEADDSVLAQLLRR